MPILNTAAKNYFFIMLTALICLIPATAFSADALSASYLRCEYRVDPLGIDIANPRLSWIVTSTQRAQKQTAYQIIVAASKTSLDKNQGGIWDSGKVKSGETAQIEYSGSPLKSKKQYFWKVRVWDKSGAVSAWSKPALWSMGFLNENEWKAKWIGLDSKLSKKQELDKELFKVSRYTGRKTYFPCPYLRKDFVAEKKIQRAMVYASALGFFELHLNGNRVGKDFFTPGWTDYNKRVYYLAYDVTGIVKQGGNVLGAILSDGWYAGNIGGRGQRIYGTQLRLRAQLHIEYSDGSEKVVASDETWKANTGPIIEADMQDGETYDARLEMPGWSKPGFDDKNWKAVNITDKISAITQAYPGIPVRKVMEIKPKSIAEPKPGVFVYQMGQNFAGCVRLKVKGKAGDKVVLRFAEMLNPDGTIYTTNLRGARVIDTYILKSDNEEVWEPRFTYHGFQYVEITGFPGKPDLGSITGIVMHSDLPLTSSFASSNTLANKIYSNTVWGQRSNYFEVPTDCPQRDERLGWMGDAQVFIPAAVYNMDIGAFYTKWMVDVEDGQHEDGGYHDVNPAVAGRVTAAWGDAGVICPWNIYRAYDDKRMIKKHYKSMRAWVEFLKQRSPGNLSPSLGGYADWLNVNDPTDNSLISTAYYGRSVRLLADMAQAIGKKEDAENDLRLFARIASSFRRYFVMNDGAVSGNSQTGYLLALHFDLLPDNLRPRAAKQLINKIKERDWSLSTGFVGCGLLLPTLTEIGRTDVAYKLLTNRKYPSWGYSIDQGATTMWERWNSYTKENGFGDPGMNSFNHYAYGAVGEWMFSTLAGIDTEEPGYKRILIRPRPSANDFSWVSASYDSIRGKIATSWKISGNDILLSVTLPANTTASVYVPAKDNASVTEGGRAAAKSPGLKFLRMENGFAVYDAGSGSYSFVSKGGKSVLKLISGTPE